MQKDKLILMDGTIVELEIGASLNDIRVVFENKESMVSTWGNFTENNLKKVQVKNCDDIVVGNYSNLELESETSIVRKDGSVYTSFKFAEKRINDLRQNVMEGDEE